jgi:hypothetical protein
MISAFTEGVREGENDKPLRREGHWNGGRVAISDRITFPI